MLGFTSIIDNASEMICVFNADGDVTYMNDISSKELEYSVGEVSIKDILPHVFEEDAVISDTVSALEEAVYDDAYRLNHTCFPVKVDFLTNDSKQFVCYMTDMRDVVSQQKQLHNFEDNMRDILKSRDEFTANLTHELRTPVNGIKGHVRNLKEDESDVDKKRKMDIVLKCCDNMETIINNLLDYAKLENGKMIIESEPFNLHELIEASISIIGSVANEKGLMLHYNISDNVPEIVVSDEFHLRQVIDNLLNNAIKFTSVGSVNLEVFRTKQIGKDMELTFFVRDTGIGMTLEERDKLFQSFTQVDGSITRTYGGTGLGLYVCKQIVELMGGSIEVHSEKGQGTTFVFTVKMLNQVDSDGEESVSTIEDLKKNFLSVTPDYNESDEAAFDDPHNIERIRDLMEKTILCVELDNWDRAEGFAEALKKLTESGPEDVSKNAFRLVMNVRKSKKDICRKYLDKLSNYIDELIA